MTEAQNLPAPLSGRRIIVTGGASGMGAGLVRALPKLGARVVSLDRSLAGRAIADEAGAYFTAVEITDAASVAEAVETAVGALNGLDVLIHAAGVAPGGAAEAISLAEWDMTLTVNATGTFLINQAVFPHLREAGGAIINFVSAAGIEGYPGKAAYAAAKGAVVAWTRSIAREWAVHNIRVNAVAAAIWTPMYDATRAAMTPDQLTLHDEAMRRAIPLGGRLGDVDADFAPVIVFLASEDARFITGQILPVDGGAIMMR